MMKTFRHAGITVSDIDRAYETLTGARIAFNYPPQVSADGYAKVAYCRGADGVTVELTQILDPAKSPYE